MRRKRILRTLPEKIKLIEAAIDYKNGGRMLTAFAAEHDINNNQLSRWIGEYKAGLFGRTEQAAPPAKTEQTLDNKLGKPVKLNKPKIIKTVTDEFNRILSEIDGKPENTGHSRPVKVILYKKGEPFTKKIIFKFDIPRFSDKKEFEHWVMCEILKNIRWQVVGFNG